MFAYKIVSGFFMFRIYKENDLIFGFDRIAHVCAQK